MKRLFHYPAKYVYHTRDLLLRGGEYTVQKRTFIVLIGIVATILSMSFINLSWTDGDEGRYFVLAKAIAGGHGQTNIHFPEPTPEWLSPPAYPWMLAMALKLLGESVVSLKLFSALCFIAFSLTFSKLVARHVEVDTIRGLGMCTIGLFGVFALSYSWLVFSETAFLLCAFLCTLAVLNTSKGSGWYWVALAGALAGLSVLIRPLGIALIPAGFLHYAIRKEWKHALLFCAASLLVNVPTIIRTYEIVHVPFAYMAFFSDASGTQTSVFVKLQGMVNTISAMLPHYFFTALPNRMFFSLFDHDCLLCLARVSWLIRPLQWLFCAIVLTGFTTRLRRIGVLEWFWLFYWPLISTHSVGLERGIEDRYILPMIPIAAIYFVVGVEWIARAACGHLKAAARTAATVIVILCSMYVLLTAVVTGWIRVHNEMDLRGLHAWAPERLEASGLASDASFARYVEAGNWIGDNTPGESVVISRKPEHTFLFSNRRGRRYDVGGSEGVWNFMKSQLRFGPVIILQDAFTPDSGYGQERMATLDPVINAHPHDLTLLFQTEPPVTRVWQIKDSTE